MPETPSYLYFFPDQDITSEELQEILTHGTRERRAWAISNLLRYAQWEDIWQFVTRDEVCELFHELDLPENLQQAWARSLKIEVPVA